ncbi:MAG: ABC transporter ATP-binding protein [Nanoarchaeota archaeon]|nr:ABC transporter ATP-binding protein [Nanoarchaeota archaeon]MBU1004325.1 ABC transporter ATP-binding protein [Nanoarchaeota archaeon]MBU1945457.1 ABC transporter ATP-binding protein [Nanoarchaeota archaeon]
MDREDLNSLVIKDLNVRYGGYLVIENLRLELKKGEFVSIVGKSGCGKTTLLNAIAGFIDYKGGIDKPDEIGFVFQNYAVFPWLNVRNNICFGLKDTKLVDHFLKVTSLEDKKNKYPFELSGGQVQRVALARTLAANPELILMDEPYGALDVYNREKMQQWLLKIWHEQKKTILFVTHSIEEAIFLSDRTLLIQDKHLTKEFVISFPRPRRKDIKFDEKFIQLKKKISESIDSQ